MTKSRSQFIAITTVLSFALLESSARPCSANLRNDLGINIIDCRFVTGKILLWVCLRGGVFRAGDAPMSGRIPFTLQERSNA
jgi:hypothetical protein